MPEFKKQELKKIKTFQAVYARIWKFKKLTKNTKRKISTRMASKIRRIEVVVIVKGRMRIDKPKSPKHTMHIPQYYILSIQNNETKEKTNTYNKTK